MATSVMLQTIDNSRELSGISWYLPELLADGSNYADVVGGGLSNRAVLATATALMTKCNEVKQLVSITPSASAISVPADVTAQREMALRVIYQDTTTLKMYRLDIPAPVDSLFDLGTDEVDIESNVAFLAWSVVFEANAVSPDGNAVNITRAYRVGRRN